MNDLDTWRLMVLKAVEAQADDETLWNPNPSSIGEAYMQQSLRWLHSLIEEADEEALKRIINQSNGDL